MKHFTIRTLAFLGVLIACSILLSRFLGFYLNDTMRISFGSIPILLAGIWFGPLAGGIVGGAADILGATLFSGLGFYPPITVGPILIGVIAGIAAKYFLKRTTFLSIAAVVLASEILGSVLWTSFALSLMTSMPFLTVMLGRIPLQILLEAIEILLVYLIHVRIGAHVTALPEDRMK